jgi:hypothetical protein
MVCYKRTNKTDYPEIDPYKCKLYTCNRNDTTKQSISMYITKIEMSTPLTYKSILQISSGNITRQNIKDKNHKASSI